MDQLLKIMDKHLKYILIDYTLTSQRQHLMQLSLYEDSNVFEFFIQMFDSPFKIRRNFYLNQPVISKFLEYLFLYLQGLHDLTKAGPEAIDWVVSQTNVT
jgi:hypothetical protein